MKKGSELLYKITYTNSYEAAAQVKITDAIPAFTEYVADSADNGAVYADGVLTWDVELDAGESITVSFKVKVVGDDATVENQAFATEDGNTISTEVIVVTVPEFESPDTGDNTQLGLWMGLMVISAGLLIALIVVLRRKKKSEEGC